MKTYIKRSLEPVLKRAAGEFSAIVLTGPRQSDKTTLLKRPFDKGYRYVSLIPPGRHSVSDIAARGLYRTLGDAPSKVVWRS